MCFHHQVGEFVADVGIRANINGGASASQTPLTPGCARCEIILRVLPATSNFCHLPQIAYFPCKYAAMTVTIQLNSTEDFKLLEPLLRLIGGAA